MHTVFHAYWFDTSKPEDKAAYAELAEKLKDWPHRMKSWGEGSHYLPALNGKTVELETAFLFDNQWNTAPIEGLSDKGLRVFDWAEDAIPSFERGSRFIKRGHWLEQTPDMREARRNTMKCGYCGKQEPAAKGYVFCPHCIDSEYLKESDLAMTRMRPIDESGIRSAPVELTAAERKHLLPLFREAQLHGSALLLGCDTGPLSEWSFLVDDYFGD